MNVNYFANNLAKGIKPTTGDVRRADYANQSGGGRNCCQEIPAEGAALIKSKGVFWMSDLRIDPFANQQVRFSDLAWGFIEHSGEHYGQLVVYYRVAGMVPPESRPKK